VVALSRRLAVGVATALYFAPVSDTHLPAAALAAVEGGMGGMSLETALVITLRVKAQLKELTATLSQVGRSTAPHSRNSVISR